MRTYELALVFRPSLTEEKRKKLLTTIKGMLKDAKIENELEWGQKALAYQIKHEKIGFYHILSLVTEIIPSDFEKKLLVSEEILRHLLVRTKDKKEEKEGTKETKVTKKTRKTKSS